MLRCSQYGGSTLQGIGLQRELIEEPSQFVLDENLPKYSRMYLCDHWNADTNLAKVEITTIPSSP